MRLRPAGGRLKRVSLSTAIRAVFAAAAVILSIYAISAHRTEVRRGLAGIGWERTAASVPLLVLALLCGMMSWRAVLRNLGSPLPVIDGGRIYFIGQLGKYLPGSVWPLLAQMELGKPYGIARKRSAAALVIAILVALVTAATVVAIALPWLTERHHAELRWLIIAVPLCLAVLHPSVLWAVLERIPLLRFVGHLGPVIPLRRMAAPVCWAAISWILYGSHLFLLAGAFHASSGMSLFVVSLGGYALAWCAGMLAFVLPAGAGARDVVLVFALSTQLPVGTALAIAVVSRALATAADLGWAALAAAKLHSPRQPATVTVHEAELSPELMTV